MNSFHQLVAYLDISALWCKRNTLLQYTPSEKTLGQRNLLCWMKSDDIYAYSSFNNRSVIQSTTVSHILMVVKWALLLKNILNPKRKLVLLGDYWFVVHGHLQFSLKKLSVCHFCCLNTRFQSLHEDAFTCVLSICANVCILVHFQGKGLNFVVFLHMHISHLSVCSSWYVFICINCWIFA